MKNETRVKRLEEEKRREEPEKNFVIGYYDDDGNEEIPDHGPNDLVVMYHELFKGL